MPLELSEDEVKKLCRNIRLSSIASIGDFEKNEDLTEFELAQIVRIVAEYLALIIKKNDAKTKVKSELSDFWASKFLLKTADEIQEHLNRLVKLIASLTAKNELMKRNEIAGAFVATVYYLNKIEELNHTEMVKFKSETAVYRINIAFILSLKLWYEEVLYDDIEKVCVKKGILPLERISSDLEQDSDSEGISTRPVYAKMEWDFFEECGHDLFVEEDICKAMFFSMINEIRRTNIEMSSSDFYPEHKEEEKSSRSSSPSSDHPLGFFSKSTSGSSQGSSTDHSPSQQFLSSSTIPEIVWFREFAEAILNLLDFVAQDAEINKLLDGALNTLKNDVEDSCEIINKRSKDKLSAVVNGTTNLSETLQHGLLTFLRSVDDLGLKVKGHGELLSEISARVWKIIKGEATSFSSFS